MKTFEENVFNSTGACIRTKIFRKVTQVETGMRTVNAQIKKFEEMNILMLKFT